jgi:CubicO group peptidase (beta-lactamase class C family)
MTFHPPAKLRYDPVMDPTQQSKTMQEPSAMHAQDPIARALASIVEAGELAGAAALAWRAGREAHVTCVGWRDVAAQLPVERDTLFRIASMTKPITSAAALMLWEEGRFALDDPISRWAPEFANMRVLRSPGGPLDATVPAERLVTFVDLLAHRSGLTYGDFHPGPLAAAYAEALGGDIDSEVAPDDWIARLAAQPLIDQPGRGWHYGHSTDLLGLLIARMEDAPLGDVLARRIFGPLGMRDTGFTVPAQKAARRAKLYGIDDAGRLAERQTGPGNSTLAQRPEGLAYVSGGQGLWSTLDDYLAFARLFAGAGAVAGAPLLRPQTVKRMVSNHLTPSQRASAELMGLPIFAEGHGFGLGVAVVLEPQKALTAVCGGGKGAVGWPGAFGGWWQADPNDHSVLIFLSHNLAEPAQLAAGRGLGAYRAITEFQALAATHV